MCIHLSLRKQKCRLKSTTTNGWRDFGQLEQHKSSVLFPIQSEKSPDSGFFTCDPTKKCIMPSSRERLKGIIGGGHDLRLAWHTHPHPPHFRLCKANDWSNNLQLVVSWSLILSPKKNKPFTTCQFPLIVTKVLLYTHDVSLAKQIFVISTMSDKPVLFSQVDVIVWHFVSVWYKSN